jgi:hypothetical protein
MEAHAPVWRPVSGSEPVPAYGFRYTVGLEHINVNTDRMLNVFREGLRNLREIWVEVLGGGDFGEVEKLGAAENAAFRFPPGVWSRVIYDYAVAYHRRRLPLEHLLKSLTPLYLGRTASFVLEMQDKDQEGAEDAIETLCLEFEKNKDYLVNNWK